MNTHDHLVQIDPQSRSLSIFRVDAAGKKTLFTKVDLPSSTGWQPAFEHFAKQLGENLLLDSPAARELLKL
jgi:hypothetical protein